MQLYSNKTPPPMQLYSNKTPPPMQLYSLEIKLLFASLFVAAAEAAAPETC